MCASLGLMQCNDLTGLSFHSNATNESMQAGQCMIKRCNDGRVQAGSQAFTHSLAYTLTGLLASLHYCCHLVEYSTFISSIHLMGRFQSF